jgi:hypothetical protein
VELRPLHRTIGVEIDRQPRTAAETAALREALDEHHLILLRGDRLPGTAQVAFAARFGPLVPERELWGYVSNARDDGIVREGAMCFHSDFAFTAAPVDAICLHALEMPDEGAPTRFADASGRGTGASIGSASAACRPRRAQRVRLPAARRPTPPARDRRRPITALREAHSRRAPAHRRRGHPHQRASRRPHHRRLSCGKRRTAPRTVRRAL